MADTPKIESLELNRETIEDLTESGAENARGGRINTAANCSNPCPKTVLLCPRDSTVMAGCSPTTATHNLDCI